MKKKTLGLILSAGFVLASGAALTACGGGENPQPEKHVDFVTVSYAGESYVGNFNPESKTFNFDTGAVVNFSAADFRVVVTYSDGTTETLSAADYQISSDLPADGVLDQASWYYISVFNGTNFSEQFTVVVADQIVDDIVEPEDLIRFTYDGTQKGVMATIDGLQTAAGKATVTQLMSQGLLTIEENSIQTATNAGSYSIGFKLPAGYRFRNGSGSCWIGWQIEKSKIPMPTVKVNGQVIGENEEINLEYKHKLQDGKYVGVEQGLELDFGDYDADILNEVLTIRGTKETAVGNTTCSIEIKAEYQDNYTIDVQDGSTWEIVKTWSIVPMKIERPTIENGDNYHYTYTPNTLVTPVVDLKGLDALYTVDGRTSAEDSADYAFTINVVPDNQIIHNYRWMDNSEIENTIYLNYYIDKADFVLPEDINDHLILEIPYTGIPSLGANGVYDYNTFADGTLKYLQANDMGTGWFEWVDDKEPEITHATGEEEYIEGQCRYLKDYQNYNYSEPITVKIKVNKRKISASYVSWQSDGMYYNNYYNNQAKTNTLSNIYNFDVESYISDKISVASTAYYKKVEGEYVPVAECVDAGEYKSVVSFNVPENYEMDDLEKEWTIQKSKLSVMVDEHCWYGTAIDSNVSYNYGNISLVEENEPQARTILLNAYPYTDNNVYGISEVSVPSAVSMKYTYYRWTGSIWDEMEEEEVIKGVGKFKAFAELTYDEDNFVIDETFPTQAETIVEIVSRTIDCSGITWEDKAVFEYSGATTGDHPVLNLPKGLWATYNYNCPSQGAAQSWAYSAVGTYVVEATGINCVWGDQVTLINTAHIIGLKNGKTYHIVAKEITAEDFYWRIVADDYSYYGSISDPTQIVNIVNGGEWTEPRIDGTFAWDCDIEYTTIARTANPNEFTTTAVITARTTDVTISAESIEMTINWNLDIYVTNDPSKVYDGEPITPVEYSLHGDLLENEHVEIEYKLRNDDESSYTTQLPVEPGDYVARVRVIHEQSFDYSYTSRIAYKYFTIDRMTPEYDASKLEGLTATYGQTIGEIELPEGFNWYHDTASRLLEVGEVNTYAVTFYPEDTIYYKPVEEIYVIITVNKADPAYEVPTGLQAHTGDKLENINLPEGFTWDEDPETYVGSEGNNTFHVTYTPSDTTNYNIISNIPVIVEVS